VVDNPGSSNTDFDNNGITGVQTGMVKSTLDADGKPVKHRGELLHWRMSLFDFLVLVYGQNGF